MKTSLSVNITPADLDRLDTIVAQFQPFVHRHAVHRVALRLGLELLAADPNRLPTLITEDRALTLDQNH